MSVALYGSSSSTLVEQSSSKIIVFDDIAFLMLYVASSVHKTAASSS